jgi:hypothetical protein
MLLLITVFTLIFIIQLMMCVYAWIIRRSIPKLYKNALGSMIDPSGTLEKYMKIIRKVDVRVNADINDIAYAQKNFLLLRRDKMYDVDLYTNFYVIFQLELTREEHAFSRKLFVIQNILFGSQIAILILGLIITSEPTIAIALGMLVFEMLLSTVAFFIEKNILNSTFEIAVDFLDLDDVERARAEVLKNDLRFRVFEYPSDMAWKIFQFLKP